MVNSSIETTTVAILELIERVYIFDGDSRGEAASRECHVSSRDSSAWSTWDYGFAARGVAYVITDERALGSRT